MGDSLTLPDSLSYTSLISWKIKRKLDWRTLYVRTYTSHVFHIFSLGIVQCMAWAEVSNQSFTDITSSFEILCLKIEVIAWCQKHFHLNWTSSSQYYLIRYLCSAILIYLIRLWLLYLTIKTRGYRFDFFNLALEILGPYSNIFKVNLRNWTHNALV